MTLLSTQLIKVIRPGISVKSVRSARSKSTRHLSTRADGTSPQVSVDSLYKEWKKRYLVTLRDGSKYVAFNLAHDSNPSNAITTSESIGYGMLISVYQNQQADFDGLLQFYNNFTNWDHGMMMWQILDNFQPTDQNSATDGDMDAAYALFKAEEKWGGGAYKDRALKICASLLTHCIKSGESHMPMVGSWAGPSDWGRLLSRSADWMPGHFLLFQQEDTAPGHADQWKATFEKTVAAYQRSLSQHKTGLVADFYKYDEGNKVYDAATNQVLESWTDKDYSTNASRVPWRLAAYYKAVGEQAVRDAGLYDSMKTLKDFFEGEMATNHEVKGGYILDGQKLNDWTTNAFMGPAWRLLKVMGSNQADSLEQKILGHLNDRYYADSILLLSVLQTQ